MERPSGSCSHHTGSAREARSFHMFTLRPPFASRFAHTTQKAHGRRMRECWWPFFSALSPTRYLEHLQHPEQAVPPAKGRLSSLDLAFLMESEFS